MEWPTDAWVGWEIQSLTNPVPVKGWRIMFSKNYYYMLLPDQISLHSVALPMLSTPYSIFCIFCNQKKNKNLILKKILAWARLLVSANEWEKWAGNGRVMSERKKANILLTNTTVSSPTWHTRTMLTGYTYMYLSPFQLPCVFRTTFFDKLSLLSWSLKQAKKILECVSCCKLQTLWWLKKLIQEMPIVWKMKS